MLIQHEQAFTEATGHVQSQQRWCQEESTAAHACARRCVEQGVVKSWTQGILLGALAAAVSCLRGGSAVGSVLWATAVIASCAATGANKIARWQRLNTHKRSELRKRMAYARHAEEEAASRPDRAAAARAKRPYGGSSSEGAGHALTTLQGRLRSRALAVVSLRSFNRMSAMALQTLARFSNASPLGATLMATMR